MGNGSTKRILVLLLNSLVMHRWDMKSFNFQSFKFDMILDLLHMWKSQTDFFSYKLVLLHHNFYASFFFLQWWQGQLMCTTTSGIFYLPTSYQHRYHRYQITLSTKVQIDGSKSPSIIIFLHRQDLNMRPHCSNLSSLTTRIHPRMPFIIILSWNDAHCKMCHH